MRMNLVVHVENQKIAGFIDFWITFECCQLANIAVHPSFSEVQPLSDGFYDCIGRSRTV